MTTQDITSEFSAPSSGVLDAEQAKLEAAHTQAVAELARLREQASSEDEAGETTAEYSQHSVAGVGIYVIPKRTGWRALLKIIHDPIPNIDFSANIYPAFDGIVGEHFQSPYLLDPTDSHYESYEDLRDNIAAVRNFLMESYYAGDSGMTPDQAKAALAEIAGFVGDGLNNNYLFAGVLPNHKFGQPFIDIDEARKPGGHGAQYIYEKILEHQRHSNWMRPFAAVVALFGGKPPLDWKLPEAHQTHFTDLFDKDIAPTTKVSGNPSLAEVNAAIAAAVATVTDTQARLDAIRDAKALTTSAQDMDAIGNHLVFTAGNMEGVAHLSEPVRRDAVDIAKDILKKLKFSLGEIFVHDGLKLKPSDDMATLGAIKGVATVYERLLAWARGNNDTAIFQHPSVLAATQAIGQLGYVAKREALRMATAAGNSVLMESLSEQIKRLPASYIPAAGTKLSSLLDTVERGIDTVMNRTQQVAVNGGMVGHTVDSNKGTSMGTSPTVTQSKPAAVVDNAASRNAQAQMADQLAMQAQAQKINAQMAAQARAQQAQGQPAATQTVAPPTTRRANTVGRQVAPARPQAAASTASKPAPTPAAPPPRPLTPAEQQAAARQATANALAEAKKREEQQRLQQQQMQQQQQQRDNAAKTAKVMAKIDPAMLKDFKNVTNTTGLAGAPIMGGRRPIDPKSIQNTVTKPAVPTSPPPTMKPAPTPMGGVNAKPVKPAVTDDEKLRNPPPLPPVPNMPPRGGGRGM